MAKTIYVYENWSSEVPTKLGILYVDQGRGSELPQDRKRLLTASDAQNTLKTNHSARPHTGSYRVHMATIVSVTFPESSMGCQFRHHQWRRHCQCV